MKKIGIIGGAGPEAGASLFMHLIRAYQHYGCKLDSDFPYITLLNVPFAPMLTPQQCTDNQKILVQQLQEAFDTLTDANVIGIACNTLHTLLPHITIPQERFISIVKSTHQALEKQKITTALFLGTSTSVALNLYEAVGKLVYPTNEEQKIVDTIIDAILANDYSGSQTLADIINACKKRSDFDGIILGCTELPLLNYKQPLPIDMPIFDTLELLAHALQSKIQ